MNTQARIVIGALLAAVVALAVVLGIVLATDEGDENGTNSPRVTDNGNDGFVGMMRAMDMMDSDSMLSHMRDVLGEAGYQRMLEHFRQHQNGTATTQDASIDQMMHQMMDGMLQHMPMDSGNMMPGTPDMQRQTPTLNEQDAHHETPTPRMTPTR